MIDPVDLNNYFNKLGKSLKDIPWFILLNLSSIEGYLRSKSNNLSDEIYEWASEVISKYMIGYSLDFDFASLENIFNEILDKMKKLEYKNMSKILPSLCNKAYEIAAQARVYVGLLQSGGILQSPSYKPVSEDLKNSSFQKIGEKESLLLDRFIVLADKIDNYVRALDMVVFKIYLLCVLFFQPQKLGFNGCRPHKDADVGGWRVWRTKN